jgi:transposase
MHGNGHVRFSRGRDGGNAVLLPDRALRSAVLWRKGSFGHQSEAGAQFVERILTTVATLRLQRRHVWDYLVRTCEAAAHGQPAPSLLPQAGS